MSTSLALGEGKIISPSERYVFLFAAIIVTFGCCLLAGWVPISFSIVTVFLFAGPHNWLEARYMMTRMPARWGPLRKYFLLGLSGVLLLAVLAWTYPWILRRWGADQETWYVAVASWNTLLAVWILALIHLRGQQAPRRDWWWAWPIGMLLIAANWLWPLAWGLLLVYLHPLLALWFLDRELGRRRPELRGTFRFCMALLPALLIILWCRLATSEDLPGEDLLVAQIVHHAGGDLLRGVSSHLLVATHVFLEMVHYCVWIVAIPLVSIRMSPWQLGNVPLARKSGAWRKSLYGLLATGALVTVILWVGFLADYPSTRDLYFTVAMLHVLAEVPFLLRLL